MLRSSGLYVPDSRSRQDQDLLFVRSGGDRPTKDWLLYHVKRICGLAGVKKVCTQSLRGLHGTLAVSRGQTSRIVADALGHETPAITEAAYLDPNVVAAERQRNAWSAIAGVGTSGIKTVPSDDRN